MSLLDDVSIVVTPNGYKAGELYAVIPVPTEGADLINDGDFPLPNTEWTIGGGAEITVDGARINNTVTGVNAYIKQVLSGIVSGKQFVLTYDVITTNGTTLAIEQNSSISLNTSTIGTNREVIFTWDRYNNDVIIKRLTTGTDVTIDNVSVKEYTSADMDVTRATDATRVDENGLVNYAEVVGGEEVTNGDFATDSDWVKATGWTISGGLANANTTAYRTLAQNIPIILGKKYKVVYDVVSFTSGSVSMTIGADSGILRNAVGTYSEIIEYNNFYSSSGIRSGASGFVGSIDNVSVKELTRDNVPRIDYTGGGCPHILAEPQRTNLVTYSEVYGSGTFFSGTTGSVIDNTTNTSPSGEDNATQVTSTGVGKIQSGALSLTQNTDYVLSFYAKNVDATAVTSRVYATGGSGGSNLTSVSYFSELSTTEWTRITHIFNTGTNTTIFVYLSNSLNSGGTIQLWGAQLEEGSYATSYIPTSGSTVTRNQDIFTRDGIGSLINSTEGVLFVEMASFVKINPSGNITLTDGSGDNRIYIYYLVDNSISVIYNINSTGAAIHNFALADITQQTKIAVKWGNSNVSVWINGSSVLSAATSNFLPNTLNQLSFSKPSGSVPFEGKVKQLQVYDTALTDTQLAALTS